MKEMLCVLEVCEINVHKNCLERVRHTCFPSGSSPATGGSLRKKRDKPRQPTMFDKIIRKSSTNSPSASMLYLCYIAITSCYFAIYGKKVKECIAVNGFPSHSYRTSLAIWDHRVLLATRHK